MTELDLIFQAQAGDTAALGELYERYIGQIYRWHFRQTNQNRESAEDLTQDTFLAAARSLPKFRHQSSFKNWLYAIAKRQLSKWIRAKYSSADILHLETTIITPAAISPAGQALKSSQLEQVFNLLSRRESDVLRCRYLQNLSVQETANELELSTTNVKVISHRALKKLKNMAASNQLDTIFCYGN